MVSISQNFGFDWWINSCHYPFSAEFEDSWTILKSDFGYCSVYDTLHYTTLHDTRYNTYLNSQNQIRPKRKAGQNQNQRQTGLG